MYIYTNTDIKTLAVTVDSKKLKCGFRDLCWVSCFPVVWDQRTVLLQLSSFYCMVVWHILRDAAVVVSAAAGKEIGFGSGLRANELPCGTVWSIPTILKIMVGYA